jgi:hypothetical protein
MQGGLSGVTVMAYDSTESGQDTLGLTTTNDSGYYLCDCGWRLRGQRLSFEKLGYRTRVFALVGGATRVTEHEYQLSLDLTPQTGSRDGSQ